MFRLIAILFVILIMGVMRAIVFDATVGGGRSAENCPSGTTTSLPV